MTPFAQALWESLLRDSPLVAGPLTLFFAATVMLWPGDLLVPKERKRYWAPVTLLVLVAVGLLVVLTPNGSGFSGMFKMDGFTRGFQLLCTLAAFLAVILSQPQFNALKEQTAEYYALIIFSLGGMQLLVGATDLVSIYFSVELMALCIYILAAYLRTQERSIEAGTKYFLLGAFSSGILLYGMSLLFAAVDGTTTNLVLLNQRLAAAPAGSSLLVFSGVLMVLVGFAFKVAAVPFHLWSPDAYEGAPTPITAFMSMAPKAAALAAFLRVFGTGLADLRAEWSGPLAFIAAASMILGNIAALKQQSMKRMLAYSSIAHVGYMLLGVLAGDAAGGARAVWLYMFTYLLMQTGAFAVVIHLQGTSEGERIEDFRGLAKRRPALAFAMMVFLLSLAGIPPLVGFFSKFYLFMAAIRSGHYALTTIALLTSAVAATYYLGVVNLMYFKEPGEQKIAHPGRSMAVVIGSACGLVLVGTCCGPWLLDWARTIAWS
jgi:NADH-quinone oxidoreductase subunit N